MFKNLSLLLSRIILLITIIIAIIFVKWNGNYLDYIFEGDQYSYFDSARLFFNSFSAHAFRTFGFPLFLGFPEIFGIYPPYWYWPILLNILFLLGIFWTLHKFTKILGTQLLLPVFIGLLLSLSFVRGMSFALTEIGFSFFIILSTYQLLNFLLNNRSINLFYFFSFLGFATLFRPGLYLFTLILIPVCFTYLLFVKKVNFKNILSIFIGLFLTLGVQSILMKRTFDTYRLTYIDDITWYRYGGALATTIDKNNCISNQCFREEQAKRDRIIDTLSNYEMSILSKADRNDILFNKTASFYKMMKVNISSNLLSGSVKESENKWLYFWTVFNNLFLSIIPFILYVIFLLNPMLRKKLKREIHLTILFVLAIIAYTILTSGISAYQGDRFHIVFYPISLLLLSILISKFFKTKNA